MPLPPPPNGVVMSACALLCAAAIFVCLPVASVRAEPEPAPAQADPPAEEAPAEPAGAGYVAPPSDVEVIRIKGRSVEAIETDVPESVTQFDAAEIEALGAQNISDLAKVTPNVEIKTAGATAPTFFIRGVGLSDFSANASGSVAIYQDEVAINLPAMQLGLLYDIEQVKIIRGPQGYGSTRNDAAGAIKIFSRKPTGELTAALRTSIGSYNLREFEGHIEAPLVDEVLSARLAFRLVERDGYAINRCTDSIARKFVSGNPDGLSTDAAPLYPPSYIQPRQGSPEGYRGWVGRNLDGYDSVVLSASEALPPDERVGPFGRQPPAAPSPPNSPYQYFPADATANRYDDVTFCGEAIGFAPSMYFQDTTTGGLLLDANTGEPLANPAPFNISQVAADLPKWMNDIGSWAARGQLRFQPRETDMDWTLKLHGSRIDQLSTIGQAVGTKGSQSGGKTKFFGGDTNQNYQDRDIKKMIERLPIPPGGTIGQPPALPGILADDLDIHPWRGDYNRAGPTKLDVWGVSLRGVWDLGPAELRSVSAYDAYDRYRDQDQDFTPDVLFESITEDSGWQFFQELELTGELEDTPLTWSVGGYYLMDKLNYYQKTLTVDLAARQEKTYTAENYSFAFYADFGWDFLDDFSLEAGVRWNWNLAPFEFLVTRIGGSPPLFNGSELWQAPTGGLALKYRFNEDVTLYWKYTRGWKPGTWNSSTNSQRGVDAARPVTIDAWELGLKGIWFDGRFSMGAAAFYYRYVDYQVFIVLSEVGSAPTLSVLNADDAEVYGAELDFRLEPLVGLVPSLLEGFVLSARAGWLQSEFIEFTNQILQRTGSFTGFPFLTTVDYAGNPLINAPRFKVSGTVEWTFDFGRFGQITPRYDVAWSDAIAFGPNNSRGVPDLFGATFFPRHAVGQRAFFLHNLRLSYQAPTAKFEISAWVRNLENFAYKTYAFDASAFQDVVVEFIGEPRMIGVDFTFNW